MKFKNKLDAWLIRSGMLMTMTASGAAGILTAVAVTGVSWIFWISAGLMWLSAGMIGEQALRLACVVARADEWTRHIHDSRIKERITLSISDEEVSEQK